MPDTEDTFSRNVIRGWDINVRLEDYGRNLKAYLLHYHQGKPSYISKLEITDLEESQAVPASAPVLELDHGAAQKLMDDLWNIGFRPATIRGRDSAENNMRRHLEDMRAITFHKLEMEPPNSKG